jgi:hypothetical protein
MSLRGITPFSVTVLIETCPQVFATENIPTLQASLHHVVTTDDIISTAMQGYLEQLTT